MSRIISGLAGSIKLKTAAKSTRPTSDRVKESLFSRLENLDVIEGSKVLDLYAGSGALGLEAASRGASEVIFVEKDKAACNVIRDNVRSVSRATGKRCLMTLQPQDVPRFLSALAGKYDLVFIDPPYETPSPQVSEVLELLLPHLEDEALVVLERSVRTAEILTPEGLMGIDSRAYGDTRIALLRRDLSVIGRP